MKKYAFFLAGTLISLIIFIASCSTKEDPAPCDNNGTVNFENKLDSTVTITMKPINIQLSLQKDFIKPVDVPANNAYTITIATPTTSRDTVVFVLPCDNILIKIL